MKKRILSLIFLMANWVGHANEYEQAKKTLGQVPPEIRLLMEQAPKLYQFESTLRAGTSSVSYTGQVFRHVLMKDMKFAMREVGRKGMYKNKANVNAMLLSYLNYNENTMSESLGVINGDSFFKVQARDFKGNAIDIDEGFFYSDIQGPGKNLISKLAGIDNPLRRKKLYGVISKTPQDYLEKLFDEFAENAVAGEVFAVPNGELSSQKVELAQLTGDGRDLAQLVQKFLYGAVSFSQAARDYLSVDLGATKGLNADNSLAYKQGANYTGLEHHWDEAFGYFGAARDYSFYTDKQISSKGSLDSNKDGFISLKSEMNFGIAINAAKMDLLVKNQRSDFTTEINRAFIIGRYLIVKKPKNYMKYVMANAHVILGAWEKVIAATLIHYINKTIKEMNEYGSTSYLYKDLAKFWSEMKGYALASQFSPKAILSDADFDRIHQLMGQVPILPHHGKIANKAYQENLLQARDILKQAYKFSDENVVSW